MLLSNIVRGSRGKREHFPALTIIAVGRPTKELLKMIHVIAVITTKPGLREEVLRAFRANVPNVLQERGCMEYGAAVDADNALAFQTKYGPDTFTVIEKWESMAALKDHAAAPHMAAYGAKVKEMLASRVIHILSPA
jgi:quinol monooxygenase YgiN